MTSEISTYLTYVNLQMAAEAMLDEVGGTLTVGGLKEGNHRSSKTPTAIAEQLIADGWTVAAHKPNTSTGLSATLFHNTETNEYVLSIRSTEFLDDAVRDNKATNELEIKAEGFAIGQLGDLENWYQDTVKGLTGGKAVTITGYSLGGHLATAFEQLHRGDGAVGKVYTFNGAGVGTVTSGTLADVVSKFNSLRSPNNDLSSLFTTPAVRELYVQLKGRLRDGTSAALVTEADLAAARALAEGVVIRGTQGQVLTQARAGDAEMLLQALTRIKAIQDEANYVTTISDSQAARPDQVAKEHPEQVEATNLNYQLAVLSATAQTESMAVFRQILTLPWNYHPVDDSFKTGKIVDIAGDTQLSAVANSQYHHGNPTPIFIEDQPEFRGAVVGEALSASWLYANVKLLVPEFSQNDFGDTHSLVLLQDSLSVQKVMAGLDTSLTLGAAGTLLNAASNANAHGTLADQGEADGNALERAVDALMRIFTGPGYTAISEQMPPDSAGNVRDRTEGGTWANIDDRNQNLHKRLADLAEATAGLGGQLRFSMADAGLADRAKTDFGALVTLLAGSPISVEASSDQALQLIGQAWGNAHARWLEDLDLNPEERAASLGNFTDKYLSDRADYLQALVTRNEKNFADDEPVMGWTDPSFIVRDKETGTTFTSGHISPSTSIMFGAEEGDDLVGTNSDQEYHLYGAAGNDKLLGNADDDWLEGQAGDDELDGGEGGDTLLGGEGNDAYVFDGSYGHETVIDADGKGNVQVNGAALGNARAAGRNTWVVKTAAGELYSLVLRRVSFSPTGYELEINREPASRFTGESILIQNFDLAKAQGSEGYLGIKLEAKRALVIAGTDDPNPFALEQAWGFKKDAVPVLEGEAAERTGHNYTIHLNQGAQAGDVLRIAVTGAGGTLKLIADGQSIEVNGQAEITLEAGQTEVDFALVGDSEISADQVYEVTATWQPVGGNAPGVSNPLQLTLDDNGQAMHTYRGDQRAPLSGHTYGWERTSWDTATGELVDGVDDHLLASNDESWSWAA